MLKNAREYVRYEQPGCELMLREETSSGRAAISELGVAGPNARLWMEPVAAAALLTICLITAAFCAQERIEINVGDEGFLWYGVQRVLHGEVPGRDFHAYEPGRYIWDAACAIVLRSDGLLQLRMANAAFAAIGLFLALLAVRRVLRSWWLLALFGAILTLWLFPRHKLFEHSIAMAGVFVAADLIRWPTLRRHFVSGVFIGVVTFFGRNHGLYMGVSLGLTALFIYLRSDRRDAFRRTRSFAGGLIIGLLPLLAMILFTPGYWRSIVESIVAMTQGTPNQQALPVPWPWRTAVSLPFFQAAYEIGTGIGFLLIPLLTGSVLLWTMLMRQSAIRGRALIIGSAMVGITYAHHAFSRADFHHLAQAMHPTLLCVMGLIALVIQNRGRWIAAVMTITLLAFTLATALYASPWADYRRLPLSDRATMQIDGHEFYVSKYQKMLLNTLKQQVRLQVKPGESFAAAPVYPFVYAFMHARSPWWDIYHLFARDSAWQQQMIRELRERHVSLIMLSTDATVDGRDDVKFPNTNPLVWKYIQAHYSIVNSPGGDVRYWHLRDPAGWK